VRWLSLAAALIDAAAFSSIWHSPVHSRKAKGLWTGIVVLLPFLGALGWVVLGRERRRG
jgi:phospholipase D-like protein